MDSISVKQLLSDKFSSAIYCNHFDQFKDEDGCLPESFDLHVEIDGTTNFDDDFVPKFSCGCPLNSLENERNIRHDDKEDFFCLDGCYEVLKIDGISQHFPMLGNRRRSYLPEFISTQDYVHIQRWHRFEAPMKGESIYLKLCYDCVPQISSLLERWFPFARILSTRGPKHCPLFFESEPDVEDPSTVENIPDGLIPETLVGEEWGQQAAIHAQWQFNDPTFRIGEIIVLALKHSVSFRDITLPTYSKNHCYACSAPLYAQIKSLHCHSSCRMEVTRRCASTVLNTSDPFIRDADWFFHFELPDLIAARSSTPIPTLPAIQPFSHPSDCICDECNERRWVARTVDDFQRIDLDLSDDRTDMDD